MRAIFEYKPWVDDDGLGNEFIIEEIVIVKKEEMTELIFHPCRSFNFVKKHRDLMFQDERKVMHCILVKPEDSDAEVGALIESEGYDYARYIALVPLKELKKGN